MHAASLGEKAMCPRFRPRTSSIARVARSDPHIYGGPPGDPAIILTTTLPSFANQGGEIAPPCCAPAPGISVGPAQPPVLLTSTEYSVDPSMCLIGLSEQGYQFEACSLSIGVPITTLFLKYREPLSRHVPYSIVRIEISRGQVHTSQSSLSMNVMQARQNHTD